MARIGRSVHCLGCAPEAFCCFQGGRAPFTHVVYRVRATSGVQACRTVCMYVLRMYSSCIQVYSRASAPGATLPPTQPMYVTLLPSSTWSTNGHA